MSIEIEKVISVRAFLILFVNVKLTPKHQYTHSCLVGLYLH